jgi:transcriptional regulator with XRE-family HTH domain
MSDYYCERHLNQKEFLQQVGSNIKRLRTASGLSVNVLADRLGIPARGFEMIESGFVEASLTDLFEIAKLLEVEPRKFL